MQNQNSNHYLTRLIHNICEQKIGITQTTTRNKILKKTTRELIHDKNTMCRNFANDPRGAGSASGCHWVWWVLMLLTTMRKQRFPNFLFLVDLSRDCWFSIWPLDHDDRFRGLILLCAKIVNHRLFWEWLCIFFVSLFDDDWIDFGMMDRMVFDREILLPS